MGHGGREPLARTVAGMKVSEWEGIGGAQALIRRQLDELRADELATHVTTGENGRQRILVATDLGLLEYAWSATTPAPDAKWSLRGSLIRWPNVHGLRLQTDAEWDPVTESSQEVWRLVAEDPKLDLSARGTDDSAEHSVAGLMAFAHACVQHAG